MRNLFNEALDTRIANNLCEYSLLVKTAGFVILNAYSFKKKFSNRKFLGYFVFSSIRSLNISASYMQVPYKVVSYERSVHGVMSAFTL